DNRHPKRRERHLVRRHAGSRKAAHERSQQPLELRLERVKRGGHRRGVWHAGGSPAKRLPWLKRYGCVAVFSMLRCPENPMRGTAHPFASLASKGARR